MARAVELAPVLRGLKQQGLSLNGRRTDEAPGTDAPRRRTAELVVFTDRHSQDRGSGKGTPTTFRLP
jgi:hypothetical protein